MEDKNTPAFIRSRRLYIAEAALEYLIALLVQSTFLARLTTYLGFSTSLTGIIQAFISLGCFFQLFSIFFRRNSFKSFVTVLSAVNQLLFMFLYIIPVIDLSPQQKQIIFVVFMFTAYFIYNIVFPKKINWLLSLVDFKKRGIFNANKEIISLITGIIFTLTMGTLIDNLDAKGELNIAFIICAIVIFVIMIAHTLTMFFSIESEDSVAKGDANGLRAAFSMLKNKDILKIVVLLSIFKMAQFIGFSFYGTYMNEELGFSLAFASVLANVGCITRIFASKPTGKYADRTSFPQMMFRCMIFLAIAHLFGAFANPLELFSIGSFKVSLGTICFLMFYVFYGFAWAGLDNASLNLAYGCAPEGRRADSLAIIFAVSGIFGFLSTVAVSPLVSKIQSSNLSLFGIPIYAQQITSLIAIFFLVICLFYIKLFITKKEKK